MEDNNLKFWNCVSQRDLSHVRTYLTRRSFFIIEVNGLSVDSGARFFQAARNVFPQDPPLGPNVNWDGFADAFLGGLDALREPKVAIVWTHVEQMLEASLCDLLVITQSMNNVAIQVSTPKSGISVPVTLILFLLGEGENFRAFDH